MPDTQSAMGDRLSDVFKDVSHSISSSELRSLWEKMQEEMTQDGLEAAVRYLVDELTRYRIRFLSEMKTLKANSSQRGSL